MPRVKAAVRKIPFVPHKPCSEWVKARLRAQMTPERKRQLSHIGFVTQYRLRTAPRPLVRKHPPRTPQAREHCRQAKTLSHRAKLSRLMKERQVWRSRKNLPGQGVTAIRLPDGTIKQGVLPRTPTSTTSERTAVMTCCPYCKAGAGYLFETRDTCKCYRCGKVWTRPKGLNRHPLKRDLGS